MARNRDVDSAEVAFRARAAGYALIIGVIGAGFGIIYFAGSAFGIILGILSGAVVAAIVYFASLGIADRSGRVAASVYHPAGASTPLPPQYSYADSLVARGHFGDAVTAYERAAAEHPGDPEPRLRQARVLRDHLADYDQAALAFKKVLALPSLKPETELVALRELVELAHKMRKPELAMAHLARIAEHFKGTPTGNWARDELADLKRSVQS